LKKQENEATELKEEIQRMEGTVGRQREIGGAVDASQAEQQARLGEQ
jgi:hypothetical protein